MEWLLGLGVCVVVVVGGVVIVRARQEKSKGEETYTVPVSTDRYEPRDTTTVDIPAAEIPATEVAAAETSATGVEEPVESAVPAQPAVPAPPMPPVPSELPVQSESPETAHTSAETEVVAEAEPFVEPEPVVEPEPEPLTELDADTGAHSEPESAEVPVLISEPESQPEPEPEPEPQLEDDTDRASRLYVDLRDHPERQLRIVVEDAALADLDDAVQQPQFYVLRLEGETSDNSHVIAVLTGDRKIGVLAESAAKHYVPLFDQLDADVLAKTTGVEHQNDRVFLPRVPTLRALIADGVTLIDESALGLGLDSSKERAQASETTARELVSAGQSA